MQRKLSEARVFALKGFTIKTEAGKFFVSPTERDKRLQQTKDQRS